MLGVGGGIAAYKVASLLRLLTEGGHQVTVVPTRAALEFVGAPTWAALSGQPVRTDVWDDVHQVPHVRVGRAADLVVVAPATADLMAKAAHGLADDLLTNALLTATCPVLMVPAMHTEMWEHPATRANVRTLRGRGVLVMEPASGRLTGADIGPGRMPEPEQVFARCLGLLGAAGGAPRQDLTGRRVVVTAGGTREALDPVRYLGNRSSGKQGYALAAVAAARGAEVVLVTTASLADPEGVRVRRVESAEQMRAAVIEEAGAADAVVMAAAVADFRPATMASTKIKKDVGGAVPVVQLVRNPDILAELAAHRAVPGQVVVGFAAETGDAAGDVVDHGRAKLRRKGCDLLVVNEVGEGKTFGADTTSAVLLDSDGGELVVPEGPKTALAGVIWDAVVQRLTADREGRSG